ncbi:MAG: hypothetical protein KDA22_13635 [Phycisphaerales bacterium]|nr:hypothetical protein [Phycisphaerales bacterium]
MRIGEMLVELGVLTPDQVDEALQEQESTGRPLGLICEDLFGVPPTTIEQAWATQYARIAMRVDPLREPCDLAVQSKVTPRQAWQFRVLPIRFDHFFFNDTATTETDLPRALRFATRVVGHPVHLVLSEPAALGAALCRRYPLAGMTPDAIGAHCDRLAS